MFGVFLDTFVALMMTALVVVSTLYAGRGPLAGGTCEGISKTNMAQIAFSSVFGNTVGPYFISVCLFFFAFSTIISWNFFGRINIAWLFGKKSIKIYYAVSMVFIFLGSCLSNDLVWELTDFVNLSRLKSRASILSFRFYGLSDHTYSLIPKLYAAA